MIRTKRVHFIGICGIGMSALAQYFVALNKRADAGEKWLVSGSDAIKGPTFVELKKARINVKIGHKKGNLPADISFVVVSQAIRPDNPELKEARRRGVRVLTYPEAVGELTEQYRTAAIAGSHGKSTTTALAALIWIRAGLDPTVIVGTMLREFGNSNFRAGRARAKDGGPGWLILEADEFGNAFRNYSPTLAAVTNIDREHLDIFKDLAGAKKAFVGFMENISSGGALVLNRDDKNLLSLRREVAAIEKRKGVRVIWHSNRSATAEKIRRAIKIPGEHNVADALAAYKLARMAGIPHRTILAAIGAYRGAWRRMEYRGRLGGAPVYDDYAHHPTEIKATLKAFREKFPRKKILCVFQPHQAKRLHALFKEFQTAFRDADAALILPVYKVAGRDEKPISGRDSEALAKAIQRREPRKRLFYLADPRRNLVNAVRVLAAPLSQYVIVMMGAGDIVELTGKLIAAKTKQK